MFSYVLRTCRLGSLKGLCGDIETFALLPRSSLLPSRLENGNCVVRGCECCCSCVVVGEGVEERRAYLSFHIMVRAIHPKASCREGWSGGEGLRR